MGDTSSDKPTPKMEAFANEYVRTGNASEAYRKCYDVSPDCLETTIWVNSCQLLSNTKVAQRVKELQLLAQEVTLITVNTLTEKLEKAYKMAKDEKLPSAMTGAIQAQAKLHGLGVEKTENKHEHNGDLGLNVNISFEKATTKQEE